MCAFFCIVSRVHCNIGLIVNTLITVSDGSSFTVVQGVIKIYWMSLFIDHIEDNVTAICVLARGLGPTLARTLEAMCSCGGVGGGGYAMTRGDQVFHGLEDVVTTDSTGHHCPDP